MTFKHQLYTASALLAVSLIVATPASFAQSETPTQIEADAGKADNAITVYKPEFFASYNPVTALDMVRQVPGFSISNGQRARGF